MKQSIVHIALIVSDCDEAIEFYTKRLGFDLLEDSYMTEQDKRWVVVAPPNGSGRNIGGCTILLAEASNDEQKAAVGNQAGGRVFLFLSTDDFWRDHRKYKANGVKFVRAPAEQDYGTVAVFEDLYGNLWDLIEHKNT